MVSGTRHIRPCALTTAAFSKAHALPLLAQPSTTSANVTPPTRPLACILCSHLLWRRSVGWSWLFPPYRCQFDVRALEPSKTIAVGAPEMRHLMAQDPLFAYRTTFEVLQTVVERLSQSRLQLLDIYSTTESRS